MAKNLPWNLIFGAVALFLLGFGPFIPTPPMPIEVAPYSLVTAIPALIASGLGQEQPPWMLIGATAGALVAPVAFGLACRSIKRSGKPIPRVSMIAFLVLVLLAYALAIGGWKITVEFTSIYRASALAIQSIIPPIVLFAIAARVRHRLTVTGGIVLHWFGLAWFTWSAFPWWGEML
jgi:hypothetical protein